MSVQTIHIDLNDGTAVRYNISDDDLDEAREKAHNRLQSIKAGIRSVPDPHRAPKKKVDHFVLDCVLLCIASERRGKGIFAGTAIKDFHFIDDIMDGMAPFGTA